MSEVTCSSTSVSLEHAEVVIGGTKIAAFIEGEIHFTYTLYPAENMGGRMEQAIPSYEEVTLDSVDLTVTLYGVANGITDCKMVGSEHSGKYYGDINFKTTSIEFYEEQFGELECLDVLGDF